LTVVPAQLKVAVPPRTESGADAKSARKARSKSAKACRDGLWSILVGPLFRALGTLWMIPNGPQPRIDGQYKCHEYISNLLNMLWLAWRSGGISRDEVLSTLDHPLRTVNAENSRFEAQGWIERSQKRMLLRVICENGAIVTVVTVMATSKFEKYGAAS